MPPSEQKLLDAIESKFSAIIERVEERVTYIHGDLKETIMSIKEELHGHTGSDEKNFDALRTSDSKQQEAMANLTSAIVTLTATVEASKKIYPTWKWYIGQVILFGGIVGGAYYIQFREINKIAADQAQQAYEQTAAVKELTSRIDDIEFTANK